MTESTPHSPVLSVREAMPEDVRLIADYWSQASDAHLLGMGADPAKMPSPDAFVGMLKAQLALPYEEKKAYALIWLADGEAVGHCNVNQIAFGEEAHMHLHMWATGHRRRGMGRELVRRSLPFFFENLKLQTLVCEPYAENPAPNRTLQLLGFEFDKRYTTVPGSINFEQEVNRWLLSREDFQNM